MEVEQAIQAEQGADTAGDLVRSFDHLHQVADQEKNRRLTEPVQDV